MSDFTKIELHILLRAITFWVGENSGDAIKKKLQSMIENHCDHKYYLQGCGEQAFAQCFRCGEVSKVVAIDN